MATPSCLATPSRRARLGGFVLQENLSFVALQATMTSSEIHFAEATVDLASLNQSLSIEFGCQLVHCVVNIGTSLDPLLPGSHTNNIALSFLDGLRASSGSTDPVIPQRLYVRESMRRIFGRFSTDANGVEPCTTRTVLVGSSGVGLSVLFFLAALCRSRTTSTLYFHSSYATGEYIAVFLMCPGPGGEVNVLFTRSLSMLNAKTAEQRDLSSIQRLLYQHQISRDKYFAFVDGSRHDDCAMVFNRYDYFCTPGGHPLFRSSEERSSRFWLLDGWTEEEAIHGLAIYGCGEDEAKEAYFLCGGNIRDMLLATTPEGYQEVRRSLDHAISLFVANQLQIAFFARERSADSRDRVLTMFQANTCGNLHALIRGVQWVDSGYAMYCLRKHLGLAGLLSQYTQCQWAREERIASFCFEHLVHSWFDFTKQGPISNVYWSRETGLTGLHEPNIYWIPRVVIPVKGPVATAPLVNAAVVVDETLYVMQTTVDTNCRVDFEALRTCVVEPIHVTLHLKFVVIYVLVPWEAERSPPPKEVTPAPWCRKRSRPCSITYVCERHHVHVTNVDSMGDSLRKLAFNRGSSCSLVKRTG
jgi:hypothetical protein